MEILPRKISQLKKAFGQPKVIVTILFAVAPVAQNENLATAAPTVRTPEIEACLSNGSHLVPSLRGPSADIEIGHTPQTETTQKQQEDPPSSPASGRIAVRGSGPQTE